MSQQPGIDFQRLIGEAADIGITQENVTGHLAQIIVRNQSYLAYRKRRGRRTPTDEVMEKDIRAIALAIGILELQSGSH
jgi:hypothetical protein